MSGDVVETVSRWVAGEAEPPTLPIFLAGHGRVYRNMRYAWADGDQSHPRDDALPAWMARLRFVRQLGFAIPTREALDLLAAHAPLLEIGAGTGFWSALLARRGVDVIATDLETPGDRGSYGFVVGAHHPTLQLAGKTAVRRWPARNVFCSWPTLDHTWFRQAARALRIGRRLIVVREDSTAEDTAWDYIDRAFELETHQEIPCFPHMNDHIEVWRKKREVRRIMDSEA